MRKKPSIKRKEGRNQKKKTLIRAGATIDLLKGTGVREGIYSTENFESIKQA